MCLQNCCTHLSVEEEATISAEERLLTYCKPVELYNILHRRSRHNPSFLSRCLHYKIQARRKRRLRAGIVIFNYKDHSNMLQKTEVTEDFSCPFCSMQCASYKGLRYHLCSSHDLFNFEFWVTEEYQAVNVSVKIDTLSSETVADGIDPRLQTFFFWFHLSGYSLQLPVDSDLFIRTLKLKGETNCTYSSNSRKLWQKKLDLNEKHVNVQFLELDSPSVAREGIHKGFLEKDDDALSCKGEKASKSFPSDKDLQNGRHGAENYGSDYPSATECVELVASSFNVPGVSIAMAQSHLDPECVKTLSGSDPAPAAILQVTKTKKSTADRSDPKNRMLLQKRQFYHSHRVQPMAMEQVMSDRDSEDEVDDDIADFEDRRMLDDFVDVSKDEKQLMHLWNSFVRKQRVLADGHVPWACEAFSKLHGQELAQSPALFWCWRLFMIKLWNHGLLDSCTMNNCNMILERCRDEGSDAGISQREND